MSPKKQIRIAAITDSPKITTGFANVARMILQHLHDTGDFKVYSLGTMDNELDIEGVLPYEFLPATISMLEDDSLKLINTFMVFLVNARPDVIFMLYDPGTLWTYLQVINRIQKMNLLKKVPIVVYTPIEGYPIPIQTAEFFLDVLDGNDGRVILYSPGSVELVETQYPDMAGRLDWAYHGLDHANFRKYSQEERENIRVKAGLNDYFVVGSFGVNKRTKGLDQVIYTARCLKDLGHSDVRFYLHTSKDKPVLSGYDLEQLAINYDVDDMVVFKPEQHKKAEEYIHGIDVEKQGDSDGLAGLSFIDRLNMLDCYLDLSQVEGWGLPPHEAMRCGVPTISIDDTSIRSEVYKQGVIYLEPVPFRMWNTWHNGVKLAMVDPMEAAKTIIELKNSTKEQLDFWSNAAMHNANKYNWKESCIKIENIIKETLQ